MSRRVSITQDGSVPEGSNPMTSMRSNSTVNEITNVELDAENMDDLAAGLSDAVTEVAGEAAGGEQLWKTKVGKKKEHRSSMLHSGTTERAAGFLDKKNHGIAGDYKDDQTVQDLLCAVDLRKINLGAPGGDTNREFVISNREDEKDKLTLRAASGEEASTWVKCLKALIKLDKDRGYPTGPGAPVPEPTDGESIFDPMPNADDADDAAGEDPEEFLPGDEDEELPDDGEGDEVVQDDAPPAAPEGSGTPRTSKKKRGSLEVINDALFGKSKRSSSVEIDGADVDAAKESQKAEKAAEKAAKKAEKEAEAKRKADEKAAKTAAKKAEVEAKKAEQKKKKEEKAAIKTLVKEEKSLSAEEQEARAQASAKLQAVQRGRSVRSAVGGVGGPEKEQSAQE